MFSRWLIISYSSPQDKELPWTTPAKSFNLNIDGLKGIIGNGDGVVLLFTFDYFTAWSFRYTVAEGCMFECHPCIQPLDECSNNILSICNLRTKVACQRHLELLLPLVLVLLLSLR